jgi:hypothetical protein
MMVFLYYTKDEVGKDRIAMVCSRPEPVDRIQFPIFCALAYTLWTVQLPQEVLIRECKIKVPEESPKPIEVFGKTRSQTARMDLNKVKCQKKKSMGPQG